MLNGDWEEVEDTLIPDSYERNGKKPDLRRFRRRAPNITNDARERAATIARLHMYANDIKFGLCSSQLMLGKQGVPDETFEGYARGQTGYNPLISGGKLTCCIAFDMIEPLWNPQLKPAERMMAWLEITCALLHEFTVCTHLEIFTCVLKRS